MGLKLGGKEPKLGKGAIDLGSRFMIEKPRVKKKKKKTLHPTNSLKLISICQYVCIKACQTSYIYLYIGPSY